jgi:hypothetical protein
MSMESSSAMSNSLARTAAPAASMEKRVEKAITSSERGVREVEESGREMGRLGGISGEAAGFTADTKGRGRALLE